MKPSEILREVAVLIALPEHHTTRVNARDSRGDKCDPRDRSATSWCVAGALVKINGNKHTQACNRARVLLRKRMGNSVSHFNDSTPHGKILRVIGHAVAEAQREEAL